MVVPDLCSSLDLYFEGAVFKPENLNGNAWFAVSQQWNPMEVVSWPKEGTFDFDLFNLEPAGISLAGICVQLLLRP